MSPVILSREILNPYFYERLTHSAAPSPAFEGGVKKHRSGSTLSKPQHLCWGVEGLTFQSGMKIY